MLRLSFYCPLYLCIPSKTSPPDDTPPYNLSSPETFLLANFSKTEIFYKCHRTSTEQRIRLLRYSPKRGIPHRSKAFRSSIKDSA